MVREAEEAAEDDKKLKARVESKNTLENYIYSVRNAINDEEKLAKVITPEDKKTIEGVVKDTTEWVDSHQSAEKEEFDEKYKEVEKIVQPIFTKLYHAQGGAGGKGGEMPTHDEL